MNLPNRLTIFRIVLIPVIILVYLFPYASFGIEPAVFTIGNTSISLVNLVALAIYVIAALTDALDGHIARSRNMITTFGKFADPIADKLMSVSALLCLTRSGVLPPFVLPVILAREVYMAAGAAVCLKHRLEVSADIYGKVATALFYPAVLMAWPWHSVDAIRGAGRVLIYISLALSIFAAAHYTLVSVKKWRERKAR